MAYSHPMSKFKPSFIVHGQSSIIAQNSQIAPQVHSYGFDSCSICGLQPCRHHGINDSHTFEALWLSNCVRSGGSEGKLDGLLLDLSLILTLDLRLRSSSRSYRSAREGIEGLPMRIRIIGLVLRRRWRELILLQKLVAVLSSEFQDVVELRERDVHEALVDELLAEEDHDVDLSLLCLACAVGGFLGDGSAGGF